MNYIGKKGDRGLETDMGEQLTGPAFPRNLVQDWDLDLEARRHFSQRGWHGRKPPKLVHNLIFSMPAGTSPQKVLGAVKKLAMNEWDLKHRYAMALHTDRAHPHVHVVLKAVSEDGQRLNIKKATLRSWRAQFAENLRELGQPANATERAVRGDPRRHQSDGRYRMVAREGSDTLLMAHSDPTRDRQQRTTHGKAGLERAWRTRGEVVAGWYELASNMQHFGDQSLAQEIHGFIRAMHPIARFDASPARQSGNVRSR